MLVIAAICAGALLLVFTGAMVRLGVKALGTPSDRAAANQMLQRTAVLLGGRFRDRTEYPWYRRPAQYGVIEGELCGLEYGLYLMPWNAEDCGGAAMLHIRARRDRPPTASGSGRTVFTPKRHGTGRSGLTPARWPTTSARPPPPQPPGTCRRASHSPPTADRQPADRLAGEQR